MGQYIIKLLQECDPLVKEIRVLDLKAYENQLGEYQQLSMNLTSTIYNNDHYRINYNIIQGHSATPVKYFENIFLRI